MKLIEAWGSGIRKMKSSLKDYPEIELVLQEVGHTFQAQFVKKEISISQLQPESQPESFDNRIINLLKSGPLSKSEISKQLGQKNVSGPLNEIIRKLIRKKMIEYTIPEKPNSRFQKYRLTNKEVETFVLK